MSHLKDSQKRNYPFVMEPQHNIMTFKPNKIQTNNELAFTLLVLLALAVCSAMESERGPL